jgi:diacylglycerol O-acyltransferase / trehalose O-mycolyltransferase / mycolyltransferase Ag85
MSRAACLVAIVAALCAGCGGGQAAPRPARSGAGVVSERQVAPRLLDLHVRSPALGRVVTVRLLTPDGWRPGAGRRWPVLFLLHGCCDDYRSWSRSTDIAAVARLRRVLVVMPDGGDVGFYSDWHGGARTRWETFHTCELPALLAARYGAGPERAIAGLSMGGLGAMDYAARHPGLFRAAASFSGVLHPRADADRWTGLFSQYAESTDVWGDPVTDRAVWNAHDPTSLARRLRGVKLFVGSGDGRDGDGTERVVGRESRSFVARLRALRIGVRADLYRGGHHDWPYWQRELHRALPTLLTPLGA